MSRLLYVTYNIPHVPATGAFTRAFHLVRAAAQLGRVTLVGLVERDLPAQPADLAALAPICDAIYTAPAPSRSSCAPHDVVTSAAAQPPSHVPSIWWCFDPRPLQQRVAELLAREPFDVLIVEHAEIAAALRPLVETWDGASLVDLHNVLSVHQQRVERAATTAHGDAPGDHLAEPHVSSAVRDIQAEECALLRAYDCATGCSHDDAAALLRLDPTAHMRVVPNGVDVDYFRPVATQPGQADTLVFTGALWYRPNVDGLRFFLRDVWPRMRACRPQIRLAIVGARPNAEVVAMARVPGVSVFGSVPDVRAYLADAALAIVPLRLGSGTRLKILEALAARRAVVSTALGAEGLELAGGRDLLIADGAEHFAAAVLHLLERPDHARNLAAHGYATVQARYDWSHIAQTFRSVLRELLGARVAGAHHADDAAAPVTSPLDL